MKHLNSLLVIASLSLGLYFSMKNARSPSKPELNAQPDPMSQAGGYRISPEVNSPKLDAGVQGEWQVILNETFEGTWPSNRWVVADLSNDGKDRKWGTDGYLAHPPSKAAAWPARSGKDGRDPTINNHDYFNNMDTRMTYGPFDLSDAVATEFSFWMWWETETNYDYIALEISRDNLPFTELGRWHGPAKVWQMISISLDDYVGGSMVWLAWRFVSNGSVVFGGPWVDDIMLSKYVPGYITFDGTLSYGNRYGDYYVAPFTTIHLFDQDIDGHNELIATTSTDKDGHFLFSNIPNWDSDDTDLDCRLDIYEVVETIFNDSTFSQRKVMNFYDITYKWRTNTIMNVPDGYLSVSIPIPPDNQIIGAMWIFQDLRNAWNYVYTHTITHIDPGSMIAKWEVNKSCYPDDPGICNSFFFAGILYPFIFIPHDSISSADIVVHETSHAYMYNATMWWWWNPNCWYHSTFIETNINCAWSEGWADFFPLVVNDDQCYDFGLGPCGIYGDASVNLEVPDRYDSYPWGDSVEGRIAGGLYDIFDDHNDGYDDGMFGFSPIGQIVLDGSINDSFLEFWHHWTETWWDKHYAIRAIFQNTIDYDDQPVINLPVLPVFENSPPKFHAIDLCSYSSDYESECEELVYEVIIFDWQCGISLDGHWIDIAPQPDWSGSCYAAIQVSDSLKSASDTFQVNVLSIAEIQYLPIINK